MSLALPQVFGAQTPDVALAFISKTLTYTPSARLTAKDAGAHEFFDELRDPHTRLPSGHPLPPALHS